MKTVVFSSPGPAISDSIGTFDLFYQMDVYQMLARMSGQGSADADYDGEKTVTADSYLQKGERLISLAKDKFERICKGLEFSSFEELLYGSKVKGDDYIGAIAKSIRQLLRKEELDSPLIKELISFLEFEISITEVAKEDFGYRYKYQCKTASSDTLLLIQLKESGYPTLNVYGSKEHTHSGRRKNLLYKTGDCVADLAEFLSVLICASIVRKVLKDPFSESYSLMKEDLGGIYSDVYYGRNLIMNSMTREKFTRDEIDADVRNGGIFKHEFWFDPRKEGSVKQISRLEPYLKSKGVTILPVDHALTVFRKRDFERVRDIPVIVSQYTQFYLTFYNPWDYLTRTDVAFHDFLECSATGSYWAKPLASYCSIFSNACKSYFKEKIEQIKTLTNLRNVSKDHATVYQTKKNIPQKTLKAMETSALNEYFGYVEYDEDVDLEKVSQVIDEFIGFKEKYLKYINSSENSIRFRKLGNHKASGLYYHFLRCLCVDFRTVSSFIHEYGHLIDYEYGNLSLKGDFSKVKNLYEKNLRKAMRENPAFAEKLSKKGKYNIDYFLTPTEVFARSFELYFSKVLMVESSLIPETFGYEYPQDEAFLNEVKDYFDATLSVINVAPKDDEVNTEVA